MVLPSALVRCQPSLRRSLRFSCHRPQRYPPYEDRYLCVTERSTPLLAEWLVHLERAIIFSSVYGVIIRGLKMLPPSSISLQLRGCNYAYMAGPSNTATSKAYFLFIFLFFVFAFFLLLMRRLQRHIYFSILSLL